jgi:two-component system, NtrC family, response regulator GlrR
MTSSSTRPVSAEYAKLPARVRLVARADGVELARHEFTRGRVTIGSAPGNDLVLDHPTVSRKHLELSTEGDALHVKDLQSKNGTRLFGLRLTEGFASVGHVLVVGLVELRIEDGTRADETVFGGLAASSTVMRQALERLRALAGQSTPVLLEGEPGVGQDQAARALHLGGLRATGPFEVLSCASLAGPTGEALLFGHAKGVVPGVDRERPGALVKAAGGTLVLEQVEALPLALQPKLLRALETKVVERLGDGLQTRVDARILSTTEKDLGAEVQAGRLRADLLRHLSAERVHLPPLRERLDDLPLLVRQALDAMGPRARGFSFSAETLAQLSAQPWPGNVRELRDAIEQALAVGEVNGPGSTLDENAPVSTPVTPQTLDYKQARDEVLSAFEREFVTHLLRTFDGNISKAAREAGVDRAYLHRLIKRHGLEVE